MNRRALFCVNRRALLCSFGTFGASCLAGCLDDSPPLDRSTTLGRLSVSNWDEESGHGFGLRVERDGTTVHESSHAVERMEGDRIPGAVVGCTWNDVPGEYAVHARVDSDEWREFDLLERADRSPDCVTASVHYEPGPGVDEPLYVLVDDGCDRIDGGAGRCPAN